MITNEQKLALESRIKDLESKDSTVQMLKDRTTYQRERIAELEQMHQDICDIAEASMAKCRELEAERDALELRIRLAEGNVARHREAYGIIAAERDEYRTKYQINAARSDERCKQLCEMESERDALKAENIALISSGLKNEAERGNDGFLMTKIADLVQERDALAIVIQKMRDGITTCLAYKATPSSELLKIGYDTTTIIKRHDAAVLRKAAEHLHAKARAYLNEFDRRVAHDMASALEKSCPPSN